MSVPVTFIKRGYRSFSLAIPPVESGKNQKVRKELESMRKDARDVYFRFTHDGSVGDNLRCTFTTTNAASIAYIRDLNKNRRLGLTEDISRMPIRCPLCDFTTQGNTPADHIKLAQHIGEAHPNLSEEDLEEAKEGEPEDTGKPEEGGDE